jgi:hypothetical protein
MVPTCHGPPVESLVGRWFVPTGNPGSEFDDETNHQPHPLAIGVVVLIALIAAGLPYSLS